MNSTAAAAGTPARPRVLHFVTGGFSGATQVAVDLVRAHAASGHFQPLLVLRRKRTTSAERVAALRAEGLAVEAVAGWAHAATVWQLAALCRRWRPDVLVAHGFSEHLWGRYAGLIAGVPHLVHVEHNSRERYTAWRLRQALWLSDRTDAIVGCSEGVRRSLLERGFPAAKTQAISNGIRLEPFASAAQRGWSDRVPGIVMSARFARQKDHATLLKAVALLRDRGLAPPVRLAGGGKAGARRAAERLCAELGLQGQVEFLGHCDSVPELLMQHQIYVLSTHYEGMPLALIEGMAAGCAVVGSDVVGVQDVVEPERNGLLAAHGDPKALADALERLLTQPAHAERMAHQARLDAHRLYGLPTMTQHYEALLRQVMAGDAHGRSPSFGTRP
ncbi:MULTISPECIES: glycosyltransferase [unclassified Acidovorax]|uniref:glycosyltransferase n=1 Tax=unclassified Acidovorax TaxID=2684926 RepID=UPI002882E5B2|nr:MULTISPECIES: glycosyltransferase [unclassified Acidovorax]